MQSTCFRRERLRHRAAQLLIVSLIVVPHSVWAQDYLLEDEQYIGFPGGGSSQTALARSGGYDYIVDQSTGLTVLDSSNPSVPRPIGFYSSPDMYATSVAANDGLVVIGDGNSGIRILDVVDPSSPHQIVHFGSWESDTPIYDARDLWIAGTACVVLTSEKLYVLDISSPTAPTIVDEITHDYSIIQGVQQGPYIYLAQGDQGLQILDVSTPASASFVGGLPIPERYVSTVAVNGDTAYVHYGGGVEIIDVSNKASPVSLGAFEFYDSAELLAASNGVLFILGSSGIYVADVSEPGGQTGAFLVGDAVTSPVDLLIDGTVLVISSVSGLDFFDLANPFIPAFVGRYNRDGKSNGMAVSGSILVMVGGSSGLSTVDLSEPFPSARQPVVSGAFMADVATSSTHAFVAVGSTGMQVFDLADPDNPVLASTFPLPGFAWGIDLSGSTAFVALDQQGIVAVDVSVPTSPVILDTLELPGTCMDVLVDATVAYVTSHKAGVHVVDVGTPSTLALIGGFDTPGEAYRARIMNNALFVADGRAGISLLDISTPANPAPLPRFRTSRPMFDVAVSPDGLVLAENELGQVEIIDFSDPNRPRRFETSAFFSTGVQAAIYTSDRFYLGGTFTYGYRIAANPLFKSDYSSPGFPPGSPGRMRCQDDYLYVAGGQAGLIIFDISNPAKPIFTGNYPLGEEFDGADDVELHGDLAFLTVGLRVDIIDVSNPSLPTKAGEIPTGATVNTVRIHNNLAYVSRDFYGVDIYDLAEPTEPTHVGTYYNQFTGITDMEFYADYGYFCAGDAGLIVLDLADPSNPMELYAQDFDEGVWDARIEGEVLYVVTTTAVKVMSFANPETPFIIAPAEIGFGPVMTDVSGTTAFTADQIRGMVIVDASVPAVPQIPSTTPIEGGGTTALAVSGNFAYVAGGRRLHVFDVSDLAAPMLTCELPIQMGHRIMDHNDSLLVAAGGLPGSGGLVSVYIAENDVWRYATQFEVTGSVTDLHLVGDRLFLTAHRMHVFDLADPAQPSELSEFVSGGNGQMNRLLVVGDLLYAVGYNGVYIHNVADPANPDPRGTWSSFAPPQDIVVEGDYAYVANASDGLQLLDLSNALTPIPLSVVDSTLSEFMRLYQIGDRLLAMGQYSAAVFDISDPSQPMQVGDPFFVGAGELFDGVLEGDVAYLVGESGLRVLNISGLDSNSILDVGAYLNPTGYTRIIRDGSRTTLGGAQLQVLQDALVEPMLSFVRSSNTIEIQWSPEDGGFILEHRPAPGEGEWTAVQGAQSPHFESMDQPRRIFRLRR